MKKFLLMIALFTFNFACVEATEDIPYTPSEEEDESIFESDLTLAEKCRTCELLNQFPAECEDLELSGDCEPEIANEQDEVEEDDPNSDL
jgi:hypothetical protein